MTNFFNTLKVASHWDHLCHPDTPHKGTVKKIPSSCTERLKQSAGFAFIATSVGFFGFTGLGASIGMGSVYYYKASKKLAFSALANRKEEESRGLIVEPNPLNKKVVQVIKKSREEGKKIKLVIGRTDSEPLPEEKDVIFVSLDIVGGSYSLSDIKKRLHLCMDINKKGNRKSLQGLFDEIIVDYSTIKFISNPWESLKPLLYSASQSRLITEVPNVFTAVDRMPEDWEKTGEIYLSKHLFRNSSLADMKQTMIRRRQNQVESYLKRLFQNVKRIDDAPYPTRDEQVFKIREAGRGLKSDLFVLTHPL